MGQGSGSRWAWWIVALACACGPARQGSVIAAGSADCVPQTCGSLEVTCGEIADGCGGTLSCGECGSGTTCGGGGVPNLCGSGDCVPWTCEARGADCGLLEDGCGGHLDCGYCPSGELCGISGTPNVCSTGECLVPSCEAEGATCGRLADGCGGQVDCGDCAAGEACGTDFTCHVAQPLPCADVQLGARVEVSEAYAMSTRRDLRRAECGPEGADLIVGWTAPYSGAFVIDTSKSTFDVSLSVRRGGCDGELLACDDNTLTPSGAAGVVIEVDGGEQLALIIEGAPVGGSSWAHLHIQPLRGFEAGVACFDGADNDADGRVDCEDAECSSDAACLAEACVQHRAGSSIPARVTIGALTPAVNAFVGSCSLAASTPDVATHFVAPTRGSYAFTLHGDATALYLVDRCGGSGLACARGPVPRLVYAMEAGESVIVVTEGTGTLRIERAGE